MVAGPLVTIFGARQNKAHLAFFTRFQCSLWSPHPPASTLWHVSPTISTPLKAAKEKKKKGAPGLHGHTKWQPGPMVTTFGARQNKAHLVFLARWRCSLCSPRRPAATLSPAIPGIRTPLRNGQNEKKGALLSRHEMAAGLLVTIFGAHQNKAHLAFLTRLRCSLWGPHPPSAAL